MLWGLLLAVAPLGAGHAALRRLAPELAASRGGWALALALGAGLQCALLAGLAGLGLLSTAAVGAVLALVAAGWLAGPRPAGPRLPGGWLSALVLGALAGYASLAALAPPTDTDELYQHLALARQIAERGGFVGGFDAPDGSRPQLVSAGLAGAYAVGGVTAARFWHLSLGLALLVGAAERAEAHFGCGRGALPLAALATSYTFAHELGLAYNDLPAALWLLLALEGALAGLPVVLGLGAGLALAAKYTAAPAVLAMGLVILARAPGGATGKLRAGAIAAALGAACLLPWWARNAAEGLHPLFPFAGWPDLAGFRFMYPEKYGAGHTWADALLLPLRVFTHAEIDSFSFLGQLSWAWGGLFLLAWGAWRDSTARWALAVVAVGFVGWGSSAQVMRYLLPLAGVAVVAAGACRFRWAPALLLLAALPANVRPLWQEATRLWPVVSGREPEEAWLAQELPAWGALRYLRDHVPPDAPVALLYAWQGYYVQQPYVLGSVEDHTPTRQWLAQHGDQSLRELHQRGVRWLLVGDVKFLRKSYPFLSDADWRTQFVEPRQKLDLLLLRDAERVYDAARWQVYRLDEPASGE